MSYIRRLIIGTFAFCLGGSAAEAVEFPQALTAEEVQCDQQQLERLALRTVVSEVNPAIPAFPENPSLFLWRLPYGGTTFGGLAASDSVRTSQGKPIRDELQVSLNLILEGPADILDPHLPLFPHASLVRRNGDSNLITKAAQSFVSVSFEAGSNVVDPTLPMIPLVINNLRTVVKGRQPLAVADARGFGLARDGLTRPCHSKLNSFDERVFRIISRSLRISNWFAGRLGDKTAWNIVLFRGEDPHLYRARIYPYAKVCDEHCTFIRDKTLDLWFIVNWDAEGRLTTGEVRLAALPSTNTIAMFLLPPMFPGHDLQGPEEFEGAPFLKYWSTNDPLNILTSPVDWSAVLAETAWND